MSFDWNNEQKDDYQLAREEKQRAERRRERFMENTTRREHSVSYQERPQRSNRIYFRVYNGRHIPARYGRLNDFINSTLYNTDEYKRDDTIELDIERKQATSDMTDNCSICMNNIKKDEYYSKLQCSHTFHHDCISEWGMRKQECPLCRAEIETKN